MRPILITGARGTLGRAFARLADERGIAAFTFTRGELDIADPDGVMEALDRHEPWAVVNAAGYARVDDAESDVERCYRENTEGPSVLARACERRGVQLLTFSSDLVFDGRKDAPYDEDDAPAPLGTYGRSKAEAEQCVLDACSTALVVRTSAIFGPWDRYNFVTVVLDRLARGAPVQAAQDAVVSPTYVPDLVHACLDLLVDGERGILHLANDGEVSWAELAREVSRWAGHGLERVEARPGRAIGWVAERPPYSVLATARAGGLPPLEHALERYMDERKIVVGGARA